MAITRLPGAGHRAMPWANGGGTTIEVAIHPAGASIAARDFDWRVSLAHVGQDGPFSALPGYDRTLTLVQGPGMVLDAGSHGRFLLDRPYAKAHFAGDWPIEAHLLDGAIDDLNVMVRRGRYRAEVALHRIDGAMDLAGPGTILALVLEGRINGCAPHDAWLIEGEGLSLRGQGVLAAIALQASDSVPDV